MAMEENAAIYTSAVYAEMVGKSCSRHVVWESNWSVSSKPNPPDSIQVEYSR
jgi:hypothetical protein